MPPLLLGWDERGQAPLPDSFYSRLHRENYLGRVAKDQPIEIGVVSKWVQVVIVLCTHAQVRLQVEGALE